MSLDKKEFVLSEFGLSNTLSLLGSVKLYKIQENSSPIVFLIDEHHGNSNNCIDKNIQNAIELINSGNVVFVGVESLAGGIEWNIDTGAYVDNDYNEKYYREVLLPDWKNNCTKFADELSVDYKDIIHGVESIGMMDKTEIELMGENPNDMSEAIKKHPLTKERSKHFIKTLFDQYNLLKLKGNIILNCGSDHNTHIVDWIESAEIDNIIGAKANYIRINTIDNI